MFKYILKRLGWMLITFFIILTLTFILVKLMPIDPPGDDARKLAIYEKMGYLKPIPEQYFIYLKNIFTEGNFGYSFKVQNMVPVWEVFTLRFPPTILLNIYTLIFALPIGFLLGIFAALKKNKWQDHTISTLTMVVISVPSFVYGFLILYLLCYKIGWFPMQLLPLSKTGGKWISWAMFVSMIPAILSQSFSYIAGTTRSMRAELTEAMTSDYILLARTKGLTKGQAVGKHAFKNAMVPILPGMIATFLGLFSGSMIIEQLFSIPGVGTLYIRAINTLDYDLIMMDTIFYTLLGLLASIIVDVSRGFLDPRIRVGSSKSGS